MGVLAFQNKITWNEVLFSGEFASRFETLWENTDAKNFTKNTTRFGLKNVEKHDIADKKIFRKLAKTKICHLIFKLELFQKDFNKTKKLGNI